MKICWDCLFSIVKSFLNVLTLGLVEHKNHKE